MTLLSKTTTIAAIATAASLSIVATAADAKKGGKGHVGYTTEQAGRVQRVLVNPYGEADGLLLDNGMAVRFPAHMSDRLTSHVRRGDTIAVQGRSSMNGEIRAFSVINRQNNQPLFAEPKPYMTMQPPKFVRYAALKPMTVTGRVAHVMRGKRGEVKSAILEDGTVARLGKHLTYAALNIQPGQNVTLTGRGTATRFGRGIEVETM